MKHSSKLWRELLLLTVTICLAITIVNLVITVYTYNLEQRRHAVELRNLAYVAIAIDMSRSEVLTKLNGFAWRRYTCQTNTWIQDVFLFGSRDLDESEMLIVNYDVLEEDTVVNRLGSFENYMLGSVTSGCEIVEL
jgi:hypothetical protein